MAASRGLLLLCALAHAGGPTAQGAALPSEVCPSVGASPAEGQQPATCPEVASRGTALVQKGSLVQRARQASLAVDSEEDAGLQTPTAWMTVLCWNVMYTNFNAGQDVARSQLASVIADTMKADVAGLQECMDENLMQAAMGTRMMKAPGTDTFNCIFWKPGAVEFLGVSGRRYLGDNARDNYSQRFVSYAKLRRGGQEFWLFSTHWCLDNICAGPLARPRHNLSAQVILNLRQELGAGSLPTIITADTNSHMDGWDQDDGIQTILRSGFQIAAKGTLAGGIDYIFVSQGHWSISQPTVGPTAPSDHASFSVKLALVGASPVAPPTPPPTTAAATTAAATTARPPPPPPSGDWYRKAVPPMKVGAWGGTCTCPSGVQYNVGDRYDACANGGASLACEGGTPGTCNKVVDNARDGMMVTCGSVATTSTTTQAATVAPTSAPSTASPCDDAVATTTVRPPTTTPPSDWYRKAVAPEKVGAWGGTCTCPSGKTYNVGDRYDACAKGPASLACEGGTPGACLQQVDPARDGMKVTCAPALAR